MPSQKKDKKKKKSIPKKDILKTIKDVEYLDLGDPFEESARRYLANKISKMIDNNEVTGTIIIPEGVYISLNSSEVKDVVRLIKAKGICDLKVIAQENNWNADAVRLIASNRINMLSRKDGKMITRKTALDLLFEQVNLSVEVNLHEVADELELKRSITKNLLKSLIDDGKVEGFYIKSSHTFIPIDMLEESIKEMIEDLETKKVVEITFNEIAEEYGITDEQVYNILLKLFNVGDIEVQLNLGQKICIIKENIQREKVVERIPEEEKKLEIEDLTKND